MLGHEVGNKDRSKKSLMYTERQQFRFNIYEA